MKRIIKASVSNSILDGYQKYSSLHPNEITKIKGITVVGNLNDTNEDKFIPALNILADLKLEIIDRINKENKLSLDSNSLIFDCNDFKALGHLAIYIYCNISVDAYASGRDITDEGLISYLKKKFPNGVINGGNLSYSIYSNTVISLNDVKNSLNYGWKNYPASEYWYYVNEYYTLTEGKYTQYPKSFSWSIKSIFGRNYEFPNTGEFESDLDECYDIFESAVQKFAPGFTVTVDRQVDEDDDIDFEDDVKFKFSDTILKTRLSSEYLYKLYSKNGSRSIISEFLKILGRDLNRVKIIKK